MASEVKHGPKPKFKVKLASGTYRVGVHGFYTKQDGLAAVGVFGVDWNSDRPAKRQAELLALRTAFLCWFVCQYEQHGGSYAQAVREVVEYPFRRLQRKHPSKKARGKMIAPLYRP